MANISYKNSIVTQSLINQYRDPTFPFIRFNPDLDQNLVRAVVISGLVNKIPTQPP